MSQRDPDEFSPTRQRQMNAAKREMRRRRLRQIRERVKGGVRQARNLARTGTRRGGSGERVPGFVDAKSQRRKRQLRRLRRAAGRTVRGAGRVGGAARKTLEDLGDTVDSQGRREQGREMEREDRLTQLFGQERREEDELGVARLFVDEDAEERDLADLFAVDDEEERRDLGDLFVDEREDDDGIELVGGDSLTGGLFK